MKLALVLVASLSAALVGCGDDSGGGSTGGSGGAGTGGQISGGGGPVGGTGGMSTGGTGGAAGGSGGMTSEPNPQIEMVTSMGTMTFELEAEKMPITTANFLEYVDMGFFDGTVIHRVIPDFVIQGGGFESGFNAKMTMPPIVLETHPEVLHDYGVLSMARTSVPDSATSQFFVVNAPGGAHGLDGDYAAFGRMLSGMSTLDAISAVPTETVGNYDDVPVTDVIVTSVTRIE